MMVEKLSKTDKTTLFFSLFLVGMAVYYAFRMFGIVPWYDELYTYYYFISRGPVYAAIHWPLPNNHVGYSVLSACLLIFGNSAFALRGISYLCSLGSLMLLYRIAGRIRKGALALVPVFLFAGLQLVNQLAVQGRGYALVTFCYLVAILQLIRITEKDTKWNYIVWAIFLLLSLWAIPSSIYMVLPLCVAGGLTLLCKKEYRKLWKLVLASLVSAAGTVFLYGVLWLAVGSNLLCKAEGGNYYGMGHIDVIRKAPFSTLKAGINYMLASPYIQSVGREGFLARFADWIGNLFGIHFSYLSLGGSTVFWGVVVVIGCVFLVKGMIRQPDFFGIYFLVSLIMLPGMLAVQCKLPYYRVFSFAGAMIALLAGWTFGKLGECFKESKIRWQYMEAITAALTFVLCILSLLHSGQSYGNREDMLSEAYRNVKIQDCGRIAVTDCDQEYLLLYQYGIGQEQVTKDLREADCVVVDRYLLGEDGYGQSQDAPELWKLYLTREDALLREVMAECQIIYENEYFAVYKK